MDFTVLRRELQQRVPYPQIFSHIDAILSSVSPESFQSSFMVDVAPFRIDPGVLQKLSSFLLGRFDRIYMGGHYALNDDFVEYLVGNASNRKVEGQCERFFEFSPNHSIRILSSESLISEGTTGYSLWEASVALLALIANNPSRFDDIFRDKRILELGSGTGLGGLSIATLSNPRTVLLTDISQVHASYTRPNLLLNPSIYKANSDILDWNELLSEDTKYAQEFDTIVGCDIVYDPEICSLLLSVFKNLFSASNSSLVAVFLICTLRNRETFDNFVQELTGNLDGCNLQVFALGSGDVSSEEIILRSIEAFRIVKIMKNKNKIKL